MEDIKKDDIKKNYPSLPPNYVSLAQLQERWLQQQQKKQQQQQEQEKRQRKQIGLTNQQNPKQEKRVYKNQENSKNGGLRANAQAVYVPRKGLDRNRPRFGGVGGLLKSGELEVRALRVGGVDGKRKYSDWENRAFKVKGGIIGGDDQMTSKGISGNDRGNNGFKEGFSGEFGEHSDNNARIEENVSVCLVGVMLESEGEKEDPVGLSGMSGDQKASNGEISRNSDDRGFQGSSMLKGKSGMGYSGELERNADDHEIMKEGNVSKADELSGKNGVSFRDGYWRSSSNWKIGRDFKHNKLEVGKSRLDEGMSMGENERNGQKGKIGVGFLGYEGKERVLGNGRPKMRRDFNALSLNDSREGNVASGMGLHRGPRGSYGNFRRSTTQKMGKVIDGGLVWMKKGEISDNKAAKV